MMCCPQVLLGLLADEVGNCPQHCGASLRIGRGREEDRCNRAGRCARKIGTLILATSAIQLANGFFGTFISLSRRSRNQ